MADGGVVDLAVVGADEALGIGGHDARPLAGDVADLGPGEACLVPDEVGDARGLAGPVDRHPQPIVGDVEERRSLRYTLYCSLPRHRERGMVATLIVG